MPLKELARSEVVTVEPSEPMQEIARRMSEEKVGSVVVSEGDRPVGIVTDRDIAVRAVANGSAGDGVVAEDVMSSDLCTAEEGDGLFEALQTMGEHSVRRLPVCNGDGELTGIITADDVRELLTDEEQEMNNVFRQQRPAY